MERESLIPNAYQIPLSAETLKKGRTALLLSMIAIAMVRANLVPSKIEGFGVAFDKSNQSAFLFVLMLLIIYLLAGFILYGFKEALENRLKFYATQRDEHAGLAKQPATGHAQPLPSGVQYYSKLLEKNRCYKPLFVCRILYDVAFPLAAGVWAVIELAIAIS